MDLTHKEQKEYSEYTQVTILGSEESFSKFKEDFYNFQLNSPSFEESYNTFHNSKYVSLNEMLPLVRKCALENNLGLTFSVTSEYVQLLIFHKTTEIKVIYPPFKISKKSLVDSNTLELLLSKVEMFEGMKWSDYYDQLHKIIRLYGQLCSNSAQEVGSWTAYIMRYILVGALFLNKNNYDDDGNAASNLPTKNKYDENNNSLPFNTEVEAIEWATTKGLTKTQATDMLKKTPPDNNGKKSRGFFQAVMRVCN